MAKNAQRRSNSRRKKGASIKSKLIRHCQDSLSRQAPRPPTFLLGPGHGVGTETSADVASDADLQKQTDASPSCTANSSDSITQGAHRLSLDGRALLLSILFGVDLS